MITSPRMPVRSFMSCKSGNFAATFAVAIFAIMGAAGLALDYSRAYSAHTAVADALDAAVIATATELNSRNMSDTEIESYVSDFFQGNLSRHGNRFTAEIHDVTVDHLNQRVTAGATTDIPTTLMSALGWESIPVSANAGSVFGADQTEVAMTFDITGSMYGTKLADLKNAAYSGIEELLSVNQDTREWLRISLVPYSEAVNVGTIFDDVTDLPLPDHCRTERAGNYLYTDDGPVEGPPFRDSRLGFCPSATLQPLTSDEALLRDSVQSLRARGYTAGHIGIQWAWYTLSPNWAPYLPASSAPGEYGPKMRKYAIIMTDGLFNTAYSDVSVTQNVNRQTSKSVEYALKTCENMKDSGIGVFTIGFALRDRIAVETMRQCASPDDGSFTYFYSADSGTELTAVYKQIAQQIKNVRLAR